MSHTAFEPDWACPPGHTIQELLTEHAIGLDAFSDAIGVSESEARALLTGQRPITLTVAKALEDLFDVPSSFWVNLEAQHQADRVRLKEVSEHQRVASWLREFPVASMAKLGWISSAPDSTTKLRACLEFFDTPTIEKWNERYGSSLTAVAFRTSTTFNSTAGAVLAWLRRGEIECGKRSGPKWSKTAFIAALGKIRQLTREARPEVFWPQLQSICDSCGVCVVFAPTPADCRASGATKFLADGRAMILLSGRYRKDDHFWFTFFHEAAHLILHDKRAIFVEDGSESTLEEEEEANRYAEQVLIPDSEHHQLMELVEHYRVVDRARAIHRFSKRIGISPGIVVGQLQHRALLPYGVLNRLKREIDIVKFT